MKQRNYNGQVGQITAFCAVAAKKQKQLPRLQTMVADQDQQDQTNTEGDQDPKSEKRQEQLYVAYAEAARMTKRMVAQAYYMEALPPEIDNDTGSGSPREEEQKSGYKEEIKYISDLTIFQPNRPKAS